MTHRIHLVSLSSEIYEDSYEHGEGDFTGCGIHGMAIGKTFASLEDAAQWLKEHFGLFSSLTEYHIEDGYIQTSITVADHSNAQNGGWFEPTEKEYEAWRKGELMLYSENFTVSYLKVI